MSMNGVPFTHFKVGVDDFFLEINERWKGDKEKIGISRYEFSLSLSRTADVVQTFILGQK